MVDLKKINIPSMPAMPKVNVDPKKMMGAVDGLVDKIPPQVAALLRKIAIALLVFFIIMAIYTGWSKGWESATPEGLQLASDTRSLFTFEIEKEYNRARKDVRMSEPEDLKFESNRQMQFEYVSEREMSNPNQKPAPEVDDFLGKEYDFRNRKNESTSTPPLATPSGDGLIASPINVEAIGAWENSDTLQQIGTAKELERKGIDLSAKPRNALPGIQAADSKSELAEDERFNKALDRLEKLEKLAAEKKRKETELKSLESQSPTTPVKKTRELDRLPR